MNKNSKIMLTKIFSGDYLKRLDNIKQWQEIDVFKEESVSQHSFKVSVFGRILLEDIFRFIENNQNAKVLSFKIECMDSFLFHDWDESLILRDMSHEIKYNDFNGEDVRRVLNNFSRYKADEEFTKYDVHKYGHQTNSSEIIIQNIGRKNDDVQTFCKLADWLAVIFYMKRERSLGNNNLDKQWIHGSEELEESIKKVKDMLIKKFKNYNLDFSELDSLIEVIYT